MLTLYTTLNIKKFCVLLTHCTIHTKHKVRATQALTNMPYLFVYNSYSYYIELCGTGSSVGIATD